MAADRGYWSDTLLQTMDNTETNVPFAKQCRRNVWVLCPQFYETWIAILRVTTAPGRFAQVPECCSSLSLCVGLRWGFTGGIDMKPLPHPGAFDKHSKPPQVHFVATFHKTSNPHVVTQTYGGDLTC